MTPDRADFFGTMECDTCEGSDTRKLYPIRIHRPRASAAGSAGAIRRGLLVPVNLPAGSPEQKKLLLIQLRRRARFFPL